MIEPRDYQRDALASLSEAPERRPAIVLPTGTGKTIIFCHWLKQLRTQSTNGLRSLILVHRDELAQQAVEKLSMIDPTTTTGVVKAERNEVSAPTVVASVQTLVREKRFAQYMAGGAPQAVIVDEAHHSRADSYHTILQRLGCFEEYGPLTLGVTATPERNDGRALGKTFERIVYHLPLLEAIRKGYLCPPKGLAVKLNCDFRTLRSAHGEIRDDDAERMMLAAMAPEKIAEAIAEHASQRKCLVFTPTVEVSKQIMHECCELGMEAHHVDGTTPMDERRVLLAWFDTATAEYPTKVLSNCAVLTEGYDCPSASCIVMARPTKSRIFYTQAIGRGLRLFPGKQDCLILDVVGVTHRHDLLSIKDLMTEDVEPAAGEERAGEVQEHEEEEQPEGELTFEPVDLFASRPFNWIRSEFGYVLDLGKQHGWVVLMEVQQGWAVDRLTRVAGRAEREEIQVIQQLGYAQGMAEDYVRRLGVEALAKRDAGWRKAPLTDSQRWMLERWRIPHRGDWTKGEASDAITKAVAGAAIKECLRAAEST
jgi:superfamily II DNA or RNA helicase